MKLLRKIFPKYAVVPLWTVLGFNMLAYYLPKLLLVLGVIGPPHMLAEDTTANVNSIFLGVDVPLVPVFIIIYVLSYVQWFVGFTLIARESEALCYRFMTGEIIAKFICLTVFIFYPTMMTRPEITQTGPFYTMVGWMYFIDTPMINLFPSLHCLESWICFRGSIHLKGIRKWYAPFSFVFTMLVFASTVLIHQHVLIDIPAGVLVAEIGLLICRLTRADRVFAFINKKRLATDARKEMSIEQQPD